MKKLDKKDRRILSELDFNARQTNSELSKKVRLSKKGVEYRINQLMNKNIILGYYPVIDFLRLGFHYNRIFIKLQYINDEVKRKIEEYVKKTDTINWAIWFRGSFDLGIAFWTKTMTELKNHLQDFILEFDKYIRYIHHSIVVKLESYPYKFLQEGKNENTLVIKETEDVKVIDKLDYSILLQLNENARMNSTQIAKNINSHYKIVTYRIKRMMRKGILLATRAKINHLELGMIYYKVLLDTSYTNKEDISKLKAHIKSLHNTIYLVDHTEIKFLDFEIIVNSVEELYRLLDNISNTFPRMIQGVRYITFGKTIKIGFLPMNGMFLK